MRKFNYAILTAGSLSCLASGATRSPIRLPFLADVQQPIPYEPEGPPHGNRDVSKALQDVLDALSTMQETYFDTFAGTWADAIDWTAAVTGTHVTSTLTGIVEGLDLKFEEACSDILRWENLINQYYTQTAFFYFGENAFSLRNQAFDDMLWVVLGWLESTKFADIAQSARVFYELASVGWDDSLCNGGMTWNPSLTPYKNAITNELFTAASISMYLYFPGDKNPAPFLVTQGNPFYNAHDPIYLENAVKSYKWLKESRMRNTAGLYQDGFHITGWHRFPNGTVNPGTGQCDELNTMVYTYNQGVLLTANRGLWLATGARSYLDDGHELVSNVIRATGWPNQNKQWYGLGRSGVLEDYCDHGLYCSQNGQTFKGIFFTHLTEFCRPLRPHERDSISEIAPQSFDEEGYQYHLARCAAYAKWVEHNADAALATKNEHGLFGMWWSVPHNASNQAEWEGLASGQQLPDSAIDHQNPISYFRPSVNDGDLNDQGRGRTVETQGGALAVLRAKWMWQALYR